MPSDLPNKDQPNPDLSKSFRSRTPQSSLASISVSHRVRTLLSRLTNGAGVHTALHLSTAGFKYTGDGDTAKCNDCGLEVSHWTTDMDPFTIHRKQKPDCLYVRSIIDVFKLNKHASALTPITNGQSTSTSDEEDNPHKRQKTEIPYIDTLPKRFFCEVSTLIQVRRRTFSHWPQHTIPSSAQMIEAGFFGCNVDDRVICVYCNLICQQWTPHTDDPCEVHKTLSPNCPYVKSKLIHPAASSIVIVNESPTGSTTGNHSPTANNLDPLQSNEIVHTAACNPAYTEIPKRHASFNIWPHENLPSVDDLVRSGLFYIGNNTIVTCFYCDGSLPNWGPSADPMVEHARWFPHCAYAQQLYGDELYRETAEARRARQERARANEPKEAGRADVPSGINVTTNIGQLHIPDESTLSRLVAARLDLSISQDLLNKNYELSIVKYCWEKQLLLKRDDFASDLDLLVACLIVQKQMKHIGRNKENIVIPSVRMRQVREQAEKEQTEVLTQGQAARVLPLHNALQSRSMNVSDNTDVQMTISKAISKENRDERQTINSKVVATNDQDQSNNLVPFNPCVLCFKEEKRLACLPCGHLAICVPCGSSLRSCPICRRDIEAFVRIYI